MGKGGIAVCEMKKLFDRFYEVTGIPLCACRADGMLLFTQPRFQGDVLPPAYFKYCLLDFSLQKRDMDHPLILMFDPGYFLGIAQLDADTFLMLGPCGPLRPSREQVYEFCRWVILPEHLLEFCDLLVRAPTFSLRRFSDALALAITLCTGRDIPPEQILLGNSTLQHSEVQPAVDKALFFAREHEQFHSPLDYENSLVEAIEKGDEELLKARLLGPMQGEGGRMAVHMLTQEKYTFVTCATLWTRAAIRGGLPQETAYSMSDSYCQRMDRLRQVTDINALAYKMALDFCAKTGEAKKREGYSLPVRQCRNYINEHLHEKITLEQLTHLTNLCTRSISAKFKNETGLSIAVYIQRERVREAEYLLAHSAYTLAEISGFLQFNSQSYFCQVFRRCTGQTPQQYRECAQAGAAE